MAPDLGKKIIATIRSVLQRCEEVGEKVGYPGEGGERRFRKWIASDLLEGVLGWPIKNVVTRRGPPSVDRTSLFNSACVCFANHG